MLYYVPIIISKTAITRQSLEVLGPVTELENGWRLDYLASARYLGDDETTIFDFMADLTAHDLPIGIGDVVEFCWKDARSEPLPLP